MRQTIVADCETAADVTWDCGSVSVALELNDRRARADGATLVA